jgi:hypothetical protein
VGVELLLAQALLLFALFVEDVAPLGEQRTALS